MSNPQLHVGMEVYVTGHTGKAKIMRFAPNGLAEVQFDNGTERHMVAEYELTPAREARAIPDPLDAAEHRDAWPVKVDSAKLVEGYKADEGKARMELVPPELLFAVADILTFGAAKYSDRNWEKGMKWGRPFGALMRHMWAWWGGKTITKENFLLGELDMETGRSHLWHAGCCIAFLIAYEARGIGTDDRFSS